MEIVILTGAGMSAESGLGTFRDVGGLWARHDLNEVATPAGFARDPARVHAFYNARRAGCRDAVAHEGHRALGRLMRARPDAVTLVTQNVDSLHEAGGARDVLHMHGRLDRALCAACGHRWGAPEVMTPDDPCPACAATATRPDVVWFGEMPYLMDEIMTALARADLFVTIGTSGSVYPAAGFVAEARRAGARTLELNLAPSDNAQIFDEAHYGPASQIVPAWVDEVLAEANRPRS